MFSARLQRTHTGWLRKSIITASYISNRYKGKFCSLIMSDITSYLLKTPFLDVHTKMQHIVSLLPLVCISSFSVAEKYVSENYFNPNNLVLT